MRLSLCWIRGMVKGKKGRGIKTRAKTDTARHLLTTSRENKYDVGGWSVAKATLRISTFSAVTSTMVECGFTAMNLPIRSWRFVATPSWCPLHQRELELSVPLNPLTTSSEKSATLIFALVHTLDLL